jgi:hypothetical protein
MATGQFTAFPINWSDVLGSFGLVGAAGGTFTGNVGIGSAPTALAGQQLQLGTRSHVFELNSNGNAYWTSNLSFDGTNWVYDTGSRPGHVVTLNGADGSLTFHTAPSGTAGSAATLGLQLSVSSAGAMSFSGSLRAAGAPAISGVNAAFRTATNRNIAVLDQGSAATVSALTDGGSSATLRLVGNPLRLSGNGSADQVTLAANGELQALAATFSAPTRVAQYTLSTLPSAASYNGYEIDVTNAAGGPKRCRSNGSVWQILNTATTVS